MPYTELARHCEGQGIHYSLGEPMSSHTTLKVGGPAEFFAEPHSEQSLVSLIALARDLLLPVFVFGAGSNLLVRDGPLPGVTIKLGKRYSGVRQIAPRQLIALAGTPLTQLCSEAASRSLTGLEFAYGIPASVGGAVVMNAGAYGGEMSGVVTAVSYLSAFGELLRAEGEAMGYSYRHSAFMSNGGTVLAAEYTLEPGNSDVIHARMQELMERRRDKQPLSFPSAGSTFKRPEGAYAAALIDECGLKGRRVGGAQVSEKHAGFLINLGGATAADFLTLIEVVQQEVLRQTGYSLDCEVRIV